MNANFNVAALEEREYPNSSKYPPKPKSIYPEGSPSSENSDLVN